MLIHEERRTLLDPIHGAVRLTDDELNIVDHSLFRRLHQIRQNGLLYLVFPGAAHSRFEHSVGTFQVAKDIVDELFMNTSVAGEKEPPAITNAEEREPGKATALKESEYDELKRLVRLAALVHDLGHGPFSHHFDPFAPTLGSVKHIIKNDMPDHSYLLDVLLEDPQTDKPVPHEFISCVLFAQISNDISLDAEDVRAVASILLGRPELVQGESRELMRLASDIVASAPVDADRMDYLLRDSKSIGVSYGLYDYNRLMKSFLPYIDSESGEPRLGIKKSGLRAVENFMQARFELFVQVYYHKTNRAIQRMLGEIADMVVREKSLSPFSWGTLDDLLKTYLALSDDYFLRILRGKVEEFPVSEESITKLADDIQQRRLWKRVHEGQNASVVEAQLKTDHPEIEVIHDEIDPEATKDLDKGASLLVRYRDGFYQVKRDATWTGESPIIRALHKEEDEVERVYVKTQDPEVLRRCRESAWELTGGGS